MSSRKGTTFLHEFREFIAFLGTLWGILAGISVFFPLSSALVEAIPLGKYGEDGGVFNIFPPHLITLVATTFTLFLVFSTFGKRSLLMAAGKTDARRRAWISLGLGMAALVAYVSIYSAYSEYAWDIFGLGSDDPRKVVFEVPLLLTYVAFFSLLTQAFMLLGMVEFYGNDHKDPDSRETSE